MNMAPIGTFIFAVICVGAQGLQNAFVTVQCKAENVGRHGQPSLLECVIQTTDEAAEAEIKVISWRKEGLERALLVLKKGSNVSKSGYKLAEPSWNNKNMNVSLLITNTEVANAGLYKCMVITNSGIAEQSTSLKVTAKYSKPVISFVPEKLTLTCESKGGYPKGKVVWIVGQDTEWTKGSVVDAMQDQSGLFHLSSKLTLLPGSIFSKYTCVVFNASGGREAQAVHVVEDQPKSEGNKGEKESDSTVRIVAPVVMIGSLIVGLLFLLLLRHHRQRRSDHLRRSVSEEEEEGLDTIDKSNQV